MAKGFSFETFGTTLSPMVSRTTLYNWAEQYPDFLDAKNQAYDCRLQWLEVERNKIITGESKGNPAPLIFTFKCVEQKLYFDKTIQEVQQKQSIDDVDTSKLSDDELSQLDALISKCKKPNS